MRQHNRSLAVLWVTLALWVFGAHSKDPKIVQTTFDSLPLDIQYFEDSDVVLALTQGRGLLQAYTLWRSEDAGASWNVAKGIPEDRIISYSIHPFDRKRAYALGEQGQNWYTNDQGKSWEKFNLGEEVGPSRRYKPLSFNANDPDKIIFNTESCQFLSCKEGSHYTTDGFRTSSLMKENTHQCVFARSTDTFKTAKGHDDRAFCVVAGGSLDQSSERKLIYSDDFFRKHEEEPRLDGDRTVKGVASVAIAKGFLVAAQQDPRSLELALYVSDDADVWHRAEFSNDHKIEQDAYTLLESTGYSIQINVVTEESKQSMGTLFSSNSNGTYFTANIQYVNRNSEGFVDFEKVQGIQGIYLVNAVENPMEVLRGREHKKVESKITFDDGRTFKKLKVKDSKDNLHLHSVTQLSNSGRVFSSPAYGLVMGVGNTGDYLEQYDKGNLFVSEDGGLTWRKALDEAHKYEFGDQGGVLVAVFDEGNTKEVQYSTDFGRSWDTVKLEDEIRALELTTVPDSTTLKFILVGSRGRRKNERYVIYQLDFEDLGLKKCGDSDFEEWIARIDEEGDADCIMGHTQRYRRRKPDAKCFVKEDFKEPEPIVENCKCKAEDFECDYNFRTLDGKCVPTSAYRHPKSACKGDTKTFKGPTGYRKIPGNTCEGGEKLDEGENDWSCEEHGKPSLEKGKIGVTKHVFDAKTFDQKVYLEQPKFDQDKELGETVLCRTDRDEVFRSNDHGKTWEKPELPDGGSITFIYPHRYDSKIVFLLTGTDKLYLSENRAKQFHSIKAPTKFDLSSSHGYAPLTFNEDHHRTLIWTGRQCDEKERDCADVAHYSTNCGEEWHTLLRHCKKCEFIKQDSLKDSDKLIFCEHHIDDIDSEPIELVSSNDWFGSRKTHFQDILTFATMSEFIVVAKKDPESNLKLDASVDGKNFADAKFPPNFNVPHQTSYTVLDSSTHSIFLLVTVSSQSSGEFGRIMKSNSNGTSYVLSVDAVNQNAMGYVDFEKMLGIEGVAMVNVVANTDDVLNKGSKKLLQTKITHNDGSQWELMKNVMDDLQKDDSKRAMCSGRGDKCALHVHGYTERDDARDTFSSASAVGLMLANGNVGEYLEYGDNKVDTFITRDAGVSWYRIREGRHMWEYGDQGSLIVIAKDGGTTDKIHYSLDEGRTWKDVSLQAAVAIRDLTTLPSDNSVNFLVWGNDESGKAVSINIDFSALYDRTCSYEADKSDFTTWIPKHPLQEDNCLFGHETHYSRKKPEADCWIKRPLEDSKVEQKNCTCERHDFECDYNFQLSSDNTCNLVPGLSAADPSQACRDNPSLVSYYDTKGYRKIPISTCDYSTHEPAKFLGEEKPCPGHEPEFARRRRGLHGFALFLVAVALPVAAAAAVGWWVWTHYDGKFGRIRLGESLGRGGGGGLGSSSSLFDADAPWIRYPVMVVSGVVAVVAALPLLAGAGVRQVQSWMGRGGGRYTTRDSFARSRGRYAVVDPDEDELLGADDGFDDEL